MFLFSFRFVFCFVFVGLGGPGGGFGAPGGGFRTGRSSGKPTAGTCAKKNIFLSVQLVIFRGRPKHCFCLVFVLCFVLFFLGFGGPGGGLGAPAGVVF